MRSLFIVFLTFLLVCCSSSVHIKDIPDKDKEDLVMIRGTSLDVPPEKVLNSADRAEIAIDAAQSVLDAIQGPSIKWHEFDLVQMVDAAQSGSIVLVYFYSNNCKACKKTDSDIYSNKKVVETINEHFYTMRADIEKFPELIKLYVNEETDSIITPTTLIIMPNGHAIKLFGYIRLIDFQYILRQLVSAKEGWTLTKL